MPKLKTKSSVKKRFSLTSTGKVRFYAAKRRHMMINKSHKMKRDSRGGKILCDADARIIKPFMNG